jgi:hypothetical protein
MKHGSLRRSISLPSEPVVDSYSPDGLSETDIDALLVESGIDPIDLDELDEHEAAPVVPIRGDVETPTTAPNGGEAA